LYYWLSAVLVLIIDQVSKLWIVQNFMPGESRPVIDGFFWLTYVQNRGAAFGLMQGRAGFFVAASVIVFAAVIYYIIKYRPPKYPAFILGLITGGAVGNLLDRVRFNYVNDFFDLHWWPVFNIADMAIVCGGILLVIYLLLQKEDGGLNG